MAHGRSSRTLARSASGGGGYASATERENNPRDSPSRRPASSHAAKQNSATQPQPKKRKRKRTKTHRAYGLPNANQILLTMVVVGMLFIQLLRPNWLVFERSNATAGLSTLRVIGANDTVLRVSWDKFCDPNGNNFRLPVDEQPFSSKDEARRACGTHTPEIVRVLTATSIALSMLSVTVALYFHLGSPSQRQIVVMGIVPGCSLLATGVLGTVALSIWQSNFGPYDNGDCFSVAVASTVIAYVVSISMGIRWRWPGIFAVDNEQQAFEVRRNWRRRPPPHAAGTTRNVADDDLDASRSVSPASPETDDAFHRVI